LNYGNRNASSTYTTEDIAKGYGAACSASILIGLGIRKALEPWTRKMTGAKLIVANSISTFFACTTAGGVNALLMRQKEMYSGIDVVTPDGQVVGLSKAAAKKAVVQTAISRYVLSVPLFIPPLALFMIEKMKMMPKGAQAMIALQLCIFGFELYLAAPLAVAFYP
jgi:hypothetical protein